MRYKFVLYALVSSVLVLCQQAAAQSYAVTNAKIVTVSGPVIEKGTVVVRNGLIEAVGPNVTAPADAQVFDGTGLTVYPGFIDAFTNLGLPAAPAPTAGRFGGGGGGGAAAAQQQQQQDSSNSNYPDGLRPEEMVFDEIRSGEAQFEANRNAGFTTALSVGRSGIFNGRSVLIDLAGDTASSMVVKDPVALHITFTTIRGSYPGSLLGTFSALRQMFNDAKRLDQLQKMYAADPKGMRRPEEDRSLEALIPVVNGKMWVVFNANRDNDIIRALDLAKEYDLKAMIAGGQEAWKYADRLKAQNVPVLLSLNFPKRTASASPDADPESLEMLRFRAETPKTAAKLASAGIKFAFQSGGLTSLNDYFSNAAKATENGLSKEAAVKAMTLAAAEIFDVSDRTGSIEQGKIANLTVVKGDLFGRDRVITHVFVDGKVFEPKPPAPDVRGGPGGRGRPQGPPQPDSAADLSGRYTISIQAPGQSLGGTLDITQQGSGLAGNLTTELGTSQIKDGKVMGNTISFSGTTNVGGQAVDFTVTATITDGKLTGTVSSEHGVMPIEGTRNP